MAYEALGNFAAAATDLERIQEDLPQVREAIDRIETKLEQQNSFL